MRRRAPRARLRRCRRGHRQAVVVQDRDAASTFGTSVSSVSSDAQLRVAVLLDDEDRLVRGR
ncbi:MAG: hypothetical protein MZV70_33760 [Desulfobacterales bacterium]|nr:hypothetical protein [Desulfobacterales bacterium]